MALNSGVKLFVLIGAAFAAVTAFWRAIHKNKRETGGGNPLGNPESPSKAPKSRLVEATSEATVIGGTSPPVAVSEPTFLVTKGEAGQNEVTCNDSVPLGVSGEIGGLADIVSPAAGGEHIHEVPVDQTSEATVVAEPELAEAVCGEHPPDQLTDTLLKDPDAQSLSVVPVEAAEKLASLQDATAERDTTPQPLQLTITSARQFSTVLENAVEKVSKGSHGETEEKGAARQNATTLPEEIPQPVQLTDVCDGQVLNGIDGTTEVEGARSGSCSEKPALRPVTEPLGSEAPTTPSTTPQAENGVVQADHEGDNLSAGASARSEESTTPERSAPESTEVGPIAARPSSEVTPIHKPGRPPKYKPSIRVSEATTPTLRNQTASETDGERTRSLGVLVHVAFDRRNRCRISLLPARNEDLDEVVRVNGQNGVESWNASQDEWFGDIVPANLGLLLEQGSIWQSIKYPELRWVLSGREIYVLAQNSTISAFVSTSRLSLQWDHLVLVNKRLERPAREALEDAGCSNLLAIDGEGGVPPGWVLFRNVRPTVAVLHDSGAGILNVLRPVHDIEIALRGGIRLGHANWLHRHPPQIRVNGATEPVEVLIDGRRAMDDGNGNHEVTGWDQPGKHIVFCCGVTQSYSLVGGIEDWEAFEAFTYQPGRRERGPSLAICGPLVASHNPAETVILSPSGNTCLLGSVPGQIVASPPRYEVSSREFLAIADFPVVWVLPAAPLQCDRSVAKIRLVNPHSPCSAPRSLTKAAHNVSLLWCYAILESSYKRLDIEPGTVEANALWQQYKSEAHRLKERLR